MKRPLRKWELIGIAVIACLGALLHFAFEWSGELRPIAVFAAVNESVFEHLKLTYWPGLFYAAVEYKFVRESTKNFIIGKTTGLYVMPAAIVALFYSYTIITRSENLIADIAIFVGAVALGQLASYNILTREQLSPSFHKAALAGLISLGVIYAVFTFYPPRLPIFVNPITGTYGIP